MGEDGALLYSFYGNNNGSPLVTAIRAIKEIYEQLPEERTDRPLLFHRLRRGSAQGRPDAG